MIWSIPRRPNVILLTISWGTFRRKSLIAHGRDESANSCAMCGFSYVLKKRARLYELISYKGKKTTTMLLCVCREMSVI